MPVYFRDVILPFIPVCLPLAAHIQSHYAATDFLNGVSVQDHMTPPLLWLIYRTYFADIRRALSFKGFPLLRGQLHLLSSIFLPRIMDYLITYKVL